MSRSSAAVAETTESSHRLPEAVRRAIEAAPVGPPDTEEEARAVAKARAENIWIDSEVVGELFKQCRRT
jgi:hypothetical protein